MGLATAVAPLGAADGPETGEPETPTPEAILARVQPGHPRLLVHEEDWARLGKRVRQDPTLRSWYVRLLDRGRDFLAQPPARYEIPDGLRLLRVSREVLDRVYTLALLYQLKGDPQFAERAARELEAAAAFPDWNPRHFLDTAEMSHAFAIGYDWLHRWASPERRAVWRRALVEKGLQPALSFYRGDRGWVRARHNWNLVCNGGIGVGALAVADEEPALAGEVLAAALRSLPRALREYGPDGAWPEGPGYWRYATQYAVVLLAALESALGTDYGLSRIPGFAEAGWFPQYITGPLNRTFNYADGGDQAVRAPELFWLARHFSRPVYVHYQRRQGSGSPLDLLWFDPAQSAAADAAAAALPLHKSFRGTEVVTLRSSWSDPRALFVGFKGGDNKANHSHLDLGTFVLDAVGQRWAVDLGADDYNLPGYFGSQRWTYYRLRAEGHNTLVVNPGSGPDQNPHAEARIVKFRAENQRALAVADLSAAWPGSVRTARRGVALLQNRQVLVQDELQTARPAEVWWFMHTPASIHLEGEGRRARLSAGAETLLVEILDPEGARFTVREAQPLPTSPRPDRQNRNQRIRKLAVQLNAVGNLRLAVRFVPLVEGRSPTAPSLQLLEEW